MSWLCLWLGNGGIEAEKGFYIRFHREAGHGVAVVL